MIANGDRCLTRDRPATAQLLREEAPDERPKYTPVTVALVGLPKNLCQLKLQHLVTQCTPSASQQ